MNASVSVCAGVCECVCDVQEEMPTRQNAIAGDTSLTCIPLPGLLESSEKLAQEIFKNHHFITLAHVTSLHSSFKQHRAV